MIRSLVGVLRLTGENRHGEVLVSNTDREFDLGHGRQIVSACCDKSSLLKIGHLDLVLLRGKVIGKDGDDTLWGGVGADKTTPFLARNQADATLPHVPPPERMNR